MSKKIFDIIPPGGAAEQDDIQSNVDADNTTAKAVAPIKNTYKPKRSGKSNNLKFFGAAALILLIGGAIFPAKAQINIYPKTEDVSVVTTIIANPGQTEVDIINKTIAGVVFTETKEYSERYNATGVDENAVKARGKIRVYNKYTPADTLTLKSGSHFLSSPKGLSYHSLTVVNVPAAKVSGGKVEPGYVDIEIEADEAGPDYNISSATFSVPKLNGTDYYATTWAEIIEPITGGASSDIRIVTKKDLDSAKESFKTKYLAEAKESLKNSVGADYIFVEDKISQQIENLGSDTKENQPVLNFEMKGTITSQVTAFKKSDLMAIAEKIIRDNLQQQGRQLAPNTVSFSISGYEEKDGLVELQVSCFGKGYWLPENDFLFNSVKGRAKNYSASILGNVPEIDKAEISIFPFWKGNVPDTQDKVNIEVKF
ncbi:MAG: hypothetical protein PHG23_02690 [Candidatus Pacebacteria bacterium]|nr:hypothetical protein [Candidatus Paceibacterota bacterium]